MLERLLLADGENMLLVTRGESGGSALNTAAPYVMLHFTARFPPEMLQAVLARGEGVLLLVVDEDGWGAVDVAAPVIGLYFVVAWFPPELPSRARTA
nr:hypothetical protein [Actinomadura graeca]